MDCSFFVSYPLIELAVSCLIESDVDHWSAVRVLGALGHFRTYYWSFVKYIAITCEYVNDYRYVGPLRMWSMQRSCLEYSDQTVRKTASCYSVLLRDIDFQIQRWEVLYRRPLVIQDYLGGGGGNRTPYSRCGTRTYTLLWPNCDRFFVSVLQ